MVYEAEQQQPHRRVALKVIRGGQFVDEQQVRMFQREAEALARLEHPDIGAIYELGRTAPPRGDGQPSRPVGRAISAGNRPESNR